MTKANPNPTSPTTVSITTIPTAATTSGAINSTTYNTSSTATNVTTETPRNATNETITGGGGNFTNSTNPTPKNATEIQSPNRDNEYPLDPASFFMAITLIGTGLVNLFRGQKFKWTTIFLGGFYSTGLLILFFILKYQNVSNPSEGVRAIYYVSCVGAGLVAGAFFVCMWPTGRVLVGGLGGLSLAMILLSLRTDGLIVKQAIRYIFMAIFTLLLAIPAAYNKFYPYVCVFATAMTGCYQIILGVDVFVRSGLLAAFKLFWGYTPASNYRYILDADTLIVLTTVGFVGGALGLGVQIYDILLNGPKQDAIKIPDEEEKLEETGELTSDESGIGILENNIKANRSFWSAFRKPSSLVDIIASKIKKQTA
ncbi:1035_t:CDS:2 [Ambispora gerdemannii]|uniref:1035_t:CDS:1 n=1 Tax=Ambispora gerdemannii TaxID=144530 RepID=A0A9N9GIC8_9GLOM|nr:1035_t:CDS:2 [Ambispora gerdemannii]